MAGCRGGEGKGGGEIITTYYPVLGTVSVEVRDRNVRRVGVVPGPGARLAARPLAALVHVQSLVAVVISSWWKQTKHFVGYLLFLFLSLLM